ncbi:MAG: hypothetical protein FJ399_13910 [Verrucomicrobia bacterium]|nr:hypothetical protein [Verrucomicrobiota bacterium]
MTPINSADQETPLDLSSFMAILRDRWALIAGGIFLGIIAAVGVLQIASPVWTAESSVLVKQQTGLPSLAGGALQGVGGGAISAALGVKGTVETDIALLQSRELVGEVVDSLLLQAVVRSPGGLPASRAFRAVPSDRPFRPLTLRFTSVPQGVRVSGKGVDTVIAAGGTVRLAGGQLTLRDSVPLPLKVLILDREAAITRCLKRLDVATAGGDLIRVTWQGDDSLSAPAAANHLVSRFLVWRKGVDRGVNAKRLDFVTAQIDSTERALSGALDRQKRFHEAASTIDPSINGKAYLESLIRLREQRESLVMEEVALSHLQGQLRTAAAKPRELAAYPSFLRSPAINQLLGRIGELDAQRVAMTVQGRREADPAVIAAAQSSAELERQLVPLATTYAQAIANQRGSLDRAIDSLNTLLTGLPRQVESAFQHEKEVETLSRTSLALNAQRVELRLATVGEGGDARIVDQARPQWRRSFPLPMPTLALSLLAGFALGLSAALFAGPRRTARA